MAPWLAMLCYGEEGSGFKRLGELAQFSDVCMFLHSPETFLGLTGDSKLIGVNNCVCTFISAGIVNQ